jgi:hypothetical protein
MHWFRELGPTLQVAVVAGAVAIATALVTAVSTATNIWLKDWLDGRARSKPDRALRRETYRKHADPLTSAAESLFWRLHEIYATDRGDYLHRGRGLTRYEKHKASSTRYRIAALLGWMVALRRELVLSNAQPDATVGPMRDAVADVQKWLAEGIHVDATSAQALARLWGVADMDIQRAGWDINSTVKSVLHESCALAVGELAPEQRCCNASLSTSRSILAPRSRRPRSRNTVRMRSEPSQDARLGSTETGRTRSATGCS